KVRCDVVEGAPCGNCRWDNVECIVQESRRRKKNIFAASSIGGTALATSAEALRAKTPSANPINITSADLRRPSEEAITISTPVGNGNDARSAGTLLDHTPLDGHGHVPHLIYQQRPGFRPENSAELLSKLGDSINNPRLLCPDPPLNPNNLFGDIRTAQFLSSLEEPDLFLYSQLPAFVKPLPGRLTSDDIKYLHAKGALSLPELGLQNALLQAYVEFVHPYMPLIELHDFLNAIHSRDGLCGQISLFLYHAVMFAATAFVDIRHLQEAGYPTRKAARKFYFAKTRLLYDFDYESDRLVLVQALLLMTYWYETPDDQKDTWHWMGVAISLAHTIGLHRNPGNTNMAPRKQKLWKRIWWSCFMRDRLVALGMRRPTRIKDEDFDVPMLVESDFELEALSDENQLLSADCALVRDLGMQRELAELCIQKAKLCVLISRMLKAQYSVLIRDATKPENTTNSTMMLFPNKTLDNLDSVNVVDAELTGWLEALPAAAQYRPLTPLDIQQGRSTVAVQRSLLHMVYYTTVSALHRPQFLPASPFQIPTASRQVQEMSRLRVRESAARITHMASELHHLRLERFLPTTGVTVILPAMIIHLLEMKNPVMEVRATATKGFRQLLRVMEKLRDIYSAADFATVFLDAALRKAAIDLNQPNPLGAAEALSAVMANGVGLGRQQRQQQQPTQQQQQQSKRQLFQQRQNHHYGQKASLRGKPATIAPALNLAGAAA
ncbi:cutinase transcription factor 1 beta, partial [Magnaporthiopsis poae ATCC 64411]